LDEILALETRPSGSHRATLESFWGASTRGDLLARAALAARSHGAVDGSLTALQAFFSAPAPPDVPLALDCESLGHSWFRAQVHHGTDEVAQVAMHFGGATDPDALDYLGTPLPSDLPAPEDLRSEAEQAAEEGWSEFAVGPFESRRIGEHGFVANDAPAEWVGWLRTREPVSASLRGPALVFLSEYRSHWAIELRLGDAFRAHALDLIDFSLWVHRPEMWSEWWLVRTVSDVGHGGRCFSRREIFAREGALVATSAWETRLRRH
jgi:acyl-CoA thioesterase-2